MKMVIFIDGSNVYYHLPDGTRIDFKKLVDLLSSGHELMRVFYYGALPDGASEKHKAFFDGLRDTLGYSVVTISQKPRHANQKIHREKGVDVALVTDFVRLGTKHSFDIGYIVSGDGDYVRAVQHVKDEGVLVYCAAWRGSESKDLKVCVDRFQYLNQIEKEILRTIPDYEKGKKRGPEMTAPGPCK